VSGAEPKLVPPGTLIFGMMFEDATCGSWNLDRGEVEAAIADCRDIGLRPVALIRLRTTETLEDRS
jgi:hypothetical protein